MVENVLYSEILLFAFVFSTLTIGYMEYYRYANLIGFLFAVVWALEFFFLKSRNLRRLGSIDPVKIHPFFGMLCFACMMFVMLQFETTVYPFVRTVAQVSVMVVIVFNITRLTGRTWPLDAGMILSVILMFAMVSDDILAAVENQRRYTFNLVGDGVNLNPNVYGTFLNFQILFYLRFLFITLPAVRKDFFSIGMTLMGGLASLISAYQILIVLGSRQNQLWMACSLISIVILAGRGRLHIGRIAVGGFFFLIAASLALFLVLESAYFARYEGFINELTGATAQKEGSAYLRIGMIKAAIELWMSSPIIGLGNDGFRINSGFAVYSHNQYTELLVNYGVVGLCLFYSLHYFLLRRAFLMWRFGTLVEKAEAHWLVIAIFGILVSNIFQPTYYEKSFGLALAGLAAIAYNQSRKNRSRLINKISNL